MPRVVALVLSLVAGCSSSGTPVTPEPGGPPWFEDVTAKLGIDFLQRAGPTDKYFMPQVMGSGVALFDADNDGRLDMLLLTNAGPKADSRNKFYRQNPDGTFRDASAGSGLDFAAYGMGVAVGDFDNDGFADVYISQYGGGKLLRNKGDATFEDVTVAAGVAQPRWGTSCSFLDYDRDGWLDFVVVNYVDYDPSRPCIDSSGRADFCHPNQHPGTAARVFHNLGRGPDGKWRGYKDVSVTSGLASKPNNGLGVLCADFNGDGWIDIFAANDARANHLWINQRNGTFVDEAMTRNIAFNAAGNPQANMGVAFADVDGDRKLDVYVTHLSEELHTLWRQDPIGRFRDVTATTGLANPRYRGTGFGTIGTDFDHDGHVDLAVANGRVMRTRTPSTAPDGLPKFWHDYAERNQLFANDGSGKFRDVSLDNPSFGVPGVYRGLAWGDFDNDGAIDLVVTAIEGPAKVFKNVAPKKGHWLIVRTYDPERKRDALGAVVTVTTGDQTRVTIANPGQSYCSSGDPRAHFGLGAAETFDELRVDWPDGTRETYPGGVVDRIVVVNRGQGRAVKP